MNHERIDATTQRWSDSHGALTIAVPFAGVVRTTMRGHARLEHAEKIMQLFEEAIARHGSIVVFDDWEAASSYDSDVRARLTEWTRAHLASIRETHILVGSKLVAMGLSVAAMMLPRPLSVYSTRGRFEHAWEQATQGARAARHG